MISNKAFLKFIFSFHITASITWNFRSVRMSRFGEPATSTDVRTPPTAHLKPAPKNAPNLNRNDPSDVYAIRLVESREPDSAAIFVSGVCRKYVWRESSPERETKAPSGPLPSAAGRQIHRLVSRRERSRGDEYLREVDIARIVTGARTGYAHERRWDPNRSSCGWKCELRYPKATDYADNFIHTSMLIDTIDNKQNPDHTIPVTIESASLRWDYGFCAFPACDDRRNHARGLCKRHYNAIYTTQKQLGLRKRPSENGEVAVKTKRSRITVQFSGPV